MTELAKTPLYKEHISLAARMVPFAGFDMPVQYPGGALGEYQTVRSGGVGIFDISHMGQIRITGNQAGEFLQYVCSNDVSCLVDRQVQYSALLDEQGTFIDDITVYQLQEHEYYLCVNAANHTKDIAHLNAEAKKFDVSVGDESANTALLAIQGASSQTLLQKHVDTDLGDIPYYRFSMASACGNQSLISRTGYTGEDGFEIYLANAHARKLWKALLHDGAEPIGLACRDMLRIEMGYALYGHEISDSLTPVEANLMWITKLKKPAFIGKKAVIARRERGVEKRLIGLKLKGRGIPRAHYPVVAEGKIVGEVTSGMFSPLTGCGVAMAYVLSDYMECNHLAVLIRDKPIAAERVKTPFVRSNVRQ
ncbi:MAG: glycine cleavage system aminomethyltransferase GcvT [Mariprofundaceae bacterium]